MPLLQKLLGHSSIRTTALYWLNIYNDNGDDTDDILAGKVWLEKPRWKLKPESAAPVNLNLERLPELITLNLLVSESRPDYSNKIHQLEQKLNQIQQEKNKKINELTREKEVLQNDLTELSEQNTILHQKKSQIATETKQIIDQLEQKLTDEQEKRLTAENNLVQEKQISHNLRQQLQAEKQNNQILQETNANLMQKLSQQEQNHASLQNTYQITLKDKQKAEALAQKEKQKADNYEAQLKSIAKSFYQWQKINCYQQLEKEQGKFQAQIVQPPPWKK